MAFFHRPQLKMVNGRPLTARVSSAPGGGLNPARAFPAGGLLRRLASTIAQSIYAGALDLDAPGGRQKATKIRKVTWAPVPPFLQLVNGAPSCPVNEQVIASLASSGQPGKMVSNGLQAGELGGERAHRSRTQPRYWDDALYPDQRVTTALPSMGSGLRTH